MASKKKTKQIKPFAELSGLFHIDSAFFDNAVILVLQGFLFVLGVIVILSVLLATGLLVL